MEVRRGYVCHLIDFYSLLSMDHVHSLSEAMTLWTHSFSGRGVKAVLGLVAQLISGHRLDPSTQRDKTRVQVAIRSYIRSIEAKMRGQFKDTGQDRTRCRRARVALRSFDDISLRAFRKQFGDTDACRRGCAIDSFLTGTYPVEVETFIRQAEGMTGRESLGFRKVAGELKRLSEKGAQVCTCASCSKIGDAVIALDAPRHMDLAHTDHSFDHLCPPIGQPHTKLPPESAANP
jgi:hypothetical protein